MGIDRPGSTAPVRRRLVALWVAASLVVVAVSLALMMSYGAVSGSVATNARLLHWTNAVLGSVAVARAGSAQAVVFAVDNELGVASADALDSAVGEAHRTLQVMGATAKVGPVASGESPDLDRTLRRFSEVGERVLDLIDEGRVDQAVEVSQGEFETAYEGLRTVLVAEQERLLETIDDSEGAVGRVASVARVLVTLLIPAAAVVVYFLLTRRRVRENRIVLEAELDAARELSEAKDEFIASLSHELRTPLTSIYGFSEVLLESGLIDPRQSMELISLINSESADLSRMVDDLLTAARLEAGALSIEISEVPLASEIEAVLEPFVRTGLPVTWSCPPVNVRADRLRIRQVLRNLVSNAQRHGGPHTRVEARRVEDVVVIAVIDDGSGVSPDIADRLFQRYIHDGRQALLAGSVGLGLAVARSLMEGMGGSIDYRRVDDSTVFTISLPVADDREPVEGVLPPVMVDEPAPNRVLTMASGAQ